MQQTSDAPRRENTKSRLLLELRYQCWIPSLRGAIATKQSRISQRKDSGLLRFVRNDDVAANLRRENGESYLLFEGQYRCLTSSLRGAIATKQSSFLLPKHPGLLRVARNDSNCVRLWSNVPRHANAKSCVLFESDGLYVHYLRRRPGQAKRDPGPITTGHCCCEGGGSKPRETTAPCYGPRPR